MPDYEKYRRQAEYAQQQADRAKNPEDKVQWLQLARGWLSLLPKNARTVEEQFEEDVRAQGTHQQDSKAKN